MDFMEPAEYMADVNPKQLKKIYKVMEAKKMKLKARMSGQDKVKDAILYVAETFEDIGLYEATDATLKLLDIKLHSDVEEHVESVNPNRGAIAKFILYKINLENAMQEIALRYHPSFVK